MKSRWQCAAIAMFALLSAGFAARTQTLSPQEQFRRAAKAGNGKAVYEAMQTLRNSAKQAVRHASATSPQACDNCVQLETIDYPGALFTVLEQVNNVGQVTGFYFDESNTFRGFLRERDGTYVPVDPPDAGVGNYNGTIVWSINDAGDVAGHYANASGIYGFVRTHDGQYIHIALGGANTLTRALDINEEGTVAGTYTDTAYFSTSFIRFRDGRIETFGSPQAGGTACSFSQICGTLIAYTDCLNDEGDVTGVWVDDADVQHGFVRYAGGPIAYFDFPGQGTYPAGINNKLEITGDYADSNGFFRGFVRSADGFIQIFEVPAAGMASGQGTIANNINQEGDIAGSYVDSNGVTNGFLRFQADGRFMTFGIPNANVYVINNNALNTMVGYFVDANGTPHGFEATPSR